MNDFTAEEQRVVLLALIVTLAITAVQLFSRKPPGTAEPPLGSAAGLAERARPARALESASATVESTAPPDPNDAPLEALMRVEGMTPALASAILRYRNDNILTSADDLKRVPGVAGDLAQRVAPGLSFPGMRVMNAPPPDRKLDLNTATVEELQRLPGVGAVTARAIAERRRSRRFGHLEELLDVPGIGPRKLERLQAHVTIGQAGRD